jgi:CheY-like chemotaxis protein
MLKTILGVDRFFHLPCLITNEIQMKNLKVLIADDEPHARNLLGILLNEYCYETIYARTGTEAVELSARHSDIDVILIDKRMPEMDGFEAAVKIRSNNKDVKIIVLSASHSGEDEKKLKETGCDDFLYKPVERSALHSLISKYF